MQNIIIDPQFQSLLPALDTETFKLLEDNILENGCRDALVLWGETLVDGHNRYAICSKHDIPYKTVSKDFPSREDALIWIITTQVARRNLNTKQISYYRGLHYRADQQIQGSHMQQAKENSNLEVESGQNVHFQKSIGSTGKRLSGIYKVNEKTIRRDANGADAIDAIGLASPIAKQMILSEEVRIDKKDLDALSKAQQDEIAEVAKQIENGTYNNKGEQADPPTQAPTPTTTALAGIDPLDAAIAKMAAVFQATLPGVTRKADKTRLQAKLRASIDALESIYSRI